jgi:hypothetical protein
MMSPPSADSVPPALELVGDDGAGKSRARAVRYKLHLAEYAVRFGLPSKNAERTLKRWVAVGREKSPADLPPFDEPQLLAGWWRRNMKWRVPPWMEALAQVSPPVELQEQGEAKVEKSADDLPPDFQLNGLAADAGDAERELWSMANGFKAEMERSRRLGNNNRWWSAYNEYRKLLDELRKWEKDRLTKRLQKGEVMETAVVVESLTRIFGSVSQTFTGCMLDLARQLRPDLDPMAARTLIYPMRDKIFAGLKQSKFQVTLVPEEAA